MLFNMRYGLNLTLADKSLLLQIANNVYIMMTRMMTRMVRMMARLELVMVVLVVVSLRLCLSQEQLSQNIVTEEVRTEVVKTKYGRVQGFVSRVGRAASSARYVEIFLGLPYASPPTANYR